MIHTEGEVDPIRDLDIILHELCVKDIERANHRIEELEKILKRSKDKDLIEELELMKKCREMLQNDQMVRRGEWSNKEIETLNRILFLTAKTVVYMVNLSSGDYIRKKNKWLQGINTWVQEHGGGSIIPYSIEFEQHIFSMSQEEKEQYLKANNSTSMVNRIIKTGYHSLNLVHFFTAGEDEVKCWTVRQGSKAPKAAGVIHTDFEKGFICAEVMKYEDLVSLGSEAQVKAEGKMKQCGKEYVVEDGDVIYFRFNVTNAPKGK